jgi:hypothetical protein
MALTQHLKDQIYRAHAEEYIDVRNSSGSTIAANTFVKITGDYSAGSIPEVVAVSDISDIPVALLLSDLTNNTNTSHPSSATRALRRGRVRITGFNTTGSAVGNFVYFTASGTLTLTGGSPPVGIVLSLETNGVIYIDIPLYLSGIPESFSSVSSNGTISTKTIEVTGGTAYTLPAAGVVGRKYRIINASTNRLTISSTSPIGNKNSGNANSIYLKQMEWLDVYDTGSVWRVI